MLLSQLRRFKFIAPVNVFDIYAYVIMQRTSVQYYQKQTFNKHAWLHLLKLNFELMQKYVKIIYFQNPTQNVYKT